MGTIGTAVDSLTDSTQGPLAAEMQGMSARSTSLGSQISDAQQRLAAYQTQLQTQFTQMNTLLAQYKQTSQALTQASGTSSSSTTNTVL
jgi:flagellar hook-associated protein 2